MFHSIWDQSRDGMRLSDENGRILMVNHSFCRMMGKSKSELEGQSLGIIYASEDQQRVVKRYKENFANRTVQPYIERPFTLWNGGKKWFGVSISYITDDLLLSVFRDITERIHDQESLKKLVHQKEILMKELQHRVKNNLNIIASLVNLEMRRIKDPEIREVFANTQSRIQSMAAIYERFSLSADIETVALDEYINDLADTILQTFTTGSIHIHLISDLDPVNIDTKRAVNLGLILNELLTNAYKYAFSGRKKGESRITLKKRDNKINLTVADNGIGLPEDFDLRTAKSMGLLLVNSLVNQLNGQLWYDRKKGTTFSLSFDIEKSETVR
jgi:PAS domain S-box-containing protein